MHRDALFFDLDGTLINSIDLWGEAIAAMFASIGIEMTREEFRKFYRPVAQLTTWLRHFSVSMGRKEELRAIRDARYISLLKEKAEWLPGAEETLRSFAGKLPLGLVTGSWMSYVNAADEKLNLKRFFAAIVTEDDMGNFSKPHPHGLLLAADRLGVAPEKCIYVGDMEADMEMAKRAGMKACLVPGAYTAKNAHREADIVLGSLRELPAALD